MNLVLSLSVQHAYSSRPAAASASSSRRSMMSTLRSGPQQRAQPPAARGGRASSSSCREMHLASARSARSRSVRPPARCPPLLPLRAASASSARARMAASCAVTSAFSLRSFAMVAAAFSASSSAAAMRCRFSASRIASVSRRSLHCAFLALSSALSLAHFSDLSVASSLAFSTSWRAVVTPRCSAACRASCASSLSRSAATSASARSRAEQTARCARAARAVCSACCVARSLRLLRTAVPSATRNACSVIACARIASSSCLSAATAWRIWRSLDASTPVWVWRCIASISARSLMFCISARRSASSAARFSSFAFSFFCRSFSSCRSNSIDSSRSRSAYWAAMSLPPRILLFMSAEALRRSAIACCTSTTSFCSSATFACALVRCSRSLVSCSYTLCISPLATPCAYTPRRAEPGV
mmetsp:Transcript_33108/g.84382  ORF Transcript_33108/g.84382 Transcript_33108/m.84382 type:complete len:416 (-) Transcript_33108:287-1534(-)